MIGWKRCIDAPGTVCGNRSGFELSVSEQPPGTILTVQISTPCEGLSEQGKICSANYLADRVEQPLENELKLSALIKSKGENSI